MDINDVFGNGRFISEEKPTNLDMDRISEIVLSLKADVAEKGGLETLEERVARIGDSQAFAWQALQVAFDFYGIKQSGQFHDLVERNGLAEFLKVVQTFYDGLILGAEFTAKGGHRE